MEFSKKPNQAEPLPLQNHHLLRHALNNIQTQFSNVFHRNSPEKINNENQLALSSDEIKSRLAGIRAYKVSTYSDDICTCTTKKKDKSMQLLCLSERDAHDLLHDVQSVGITNSAALANDSWKVLDTPLSQVVAEYEGAAIRLVPELSQVKSAMKETKKNSFSGVPVFQSENLVVNDRRTGRKYHPTYLRKEDLESTRSAFLSPKDINEDIIRVATLEDTIQEMKDSSTSKSKDVIFVGPGMSWSWFFEQSRTQLIQIHPRARI